jgi:two-component system sensor histidine kinase GlrK
MISNLLDLSKIEAGVIEYEMKSQDLIALVQNALAEIEVQANEKEILLKAEFPDEPLLVECDSGRIMQVIVNLVGNAVKFSSKKGFVRVDVETIHQIPKQMPESQRNMVLHSGDRKYYGLVTVTDFGTGIPDADKERIFEKFQQVRRENRLPGQGAGLGLAISRTIVEAHRGAVWVEDNPEGGSCFRLLLQSGYFGNSEHQGSAEIIREQKS